MNSIYFTEAELDTLKLLPTQPSHSAMWSKLSSFASAHVNDTPPAEVYDLSVAYDIMDHIETIGFVYAMTEDTAYAEATKRWLLAVSGWSKWGSAPDQHSNYLISKGVAFGYSVLRDYLTPAERQTVIDSITSKLAPVYDGLTTTQWQYNHFAENYPNTVSMNGCVFGLCGLALKGDVPYAQDWITFGVDQVQRSLTYGGIDGGHAEGYFYATAWLRWLSFIDAVKRVDGIDLFNNEFLRNFPYYLIYGTYNNRFLQMEDSSWSDGYHGQWLHFMYRLAAEYNNEYAQYFANKYAAQNLALSYIYKSPTLLATPPDSLPLTRHFRGIGYVIFRAGWEPNDLLFAFKSGTSRGHAHPSQNEFGIYHNGKPITCGPGYASGNDPEALTWSHNCLLVDGNGQCSEPGDWGSCGLGTRGQIVDVTTGSFYRYVMGDGSSVYTGWSGIPMGGGEPYEAGKLDKWLRQVVFVENPDYFVIYDQVAAESPKTFDWLLQCKNLNYETINLTVDDNLINLTKSGGTPVNTSVQLRTIMLEPEGFAYEIIPVDKPYGRSYKYIKVRPPVASDKAQFLAVMFPGATLPLGKVEQGNCVGVLASYNNRVDLTLFSQDGNPVDQFIELGGYYKPADGETYQFDETRVRARFNGYQVMRLQSTEVPVPPPSPSLAGVGIAGVFVLLAVLAAIASKRRAK